MSYHSYTFRGNGACAAFVHIVCGPPPQPIYLRTYQSSFSQRCIVALCSLDRPMLHGLAYMKPLTQSRTMKYATGSLFPNLIATVTAAI